MEEDTGHSCEEVEGVGRAEFMTAYRGTAEGAVIEEGEVNGRQKHMTAHQ